MGFVYVRFMFGAFAKLVCISKCYLKKKRYRCPIRHRGKQALDHKRVKSGVCMFLMPH